MSLSHLTNMLMPCDKPYIPDRFFSTLQKPVGSHNVLPLTPLRRFCGPADGQSFDLRLHVNFMRGWGRRPASVAERQPGTHF